jgi:glycosyltransferase involved in cell wall biosynthesis
MIDLMRKQHDVAAVDIGPPPAATGARKHAVRALRVAGACRTLFTGAFEGRRVCYLACEGGAGLLYTILLLALARGLRYGIYLHHHSFNYIDRDKGLMRTLLAVAGGSVSHIFLCTIMQERFESRYGRKVRAEIISNAAFLDLGASGEQSSAPVNGPLMLGHLSNLTREKGLYLFIDLLRGAVNAGLDIRGVLAGPIALAEDRLAVERAVDDLGGRLEYRGALYGTAKEDFYRAMDIFVFPTAYANEAQPTVLFEAQAHGNIVIATNRGCIGQQIEAPGIAVSQDADFVSRTLSLLSAFSGDPRSIARGKHAVKSRFAERRAAAYAATQKFIAAMAAPATSGSAR